MKKLSKLLLALSFVLSITTSAFAVTVVSWGGAYTESQKLGYGDPTAAKLGIPVNWVDYTGGLSEIKAQKEAGKITWDIIDVYAKDTIIGCDEGIFHEFDFDKDCKKCEPEQPKGPSEDEVGYSDILYADIETNTSGDHEPYMFCLMDEASSDRWCWKGSDCVDRALNKLSYFKRPLVYFHNLGYDSKFIVDKMSKVMNLYLSM